jgi:hypothetical protein
MHHLIETGIIAQVKYCLAQIGDSRDGSHSKDSPSFLFGYQMGRGCSGVLGGCKPGVGIKLALMVSRQGAGRPDRA